MEQDFGKRISKLSNTIWPLFAVERYKLLQATLALSMPTVISHES